MGLVSSPNWEISQLAENDAGEPTVEPDKVFQFVSGGSDIFFVNRSPSDSQTSPSSASRRVESDSRCAPFSVGSIVNERQVNTLRLLATRTRYRSGGMECELHLFTES